MILRNLVRNISVDNEVSGTAFRAFVLHRLQKRKCVVPHLRYRVFQRIAKLLSSYISLNVPASIF